MGFHMCPKPQTGYIHGLEKPIYSSNSSGDNEVIFANGRSWRFPDALSYYIYDCGYEPPLEFVEDVMSAEADSALRFQTRSLTTKTISDEYSISSGGTIGYLSQEDVDRAAKNPWTPPKEFHERLLVVTSKIKGFDRSYAQAIQGPNF